MASLQIRGVQKRFGEQAILHGIDLDIADGEFVVFVGPSGCGKSTLLRTISGLEEADGGSIAIGGRDMRNVPPAQRGIAMVFQSYALYPHMTVFENLAFGLKLAGTPAPQVREKVMQAAASLRIEALLERRPKELSGGQRQRVAIGRAIVRRPDVFLFDEPLSNLDAALRVQMRIELKNLHRSLGSTMIYVTHDQVEAMTLADRIVVLRGGRVEQVGPPLELYQRPANLFVAGFLGAPQMNFLRGRAAGAGVVLDGGSRMALPAASALARDSEITAGLRPEHVTLLREGEGIPADVQATELLGDASYIYLKTAAGEQLVARAEADHHWLPGDRAVLQADAARWHLFDHEGLAVRQG